MEQPIPLVMPEKAHLAATFVEEVENNSLPLARAKAQPKNTNTFTSRIKSWLRSAYRWLFTLMAVLNIIGLALFIAFAPRPYPRQHLVTATTANLVITILCRQDYVFNSMYKLCRVIPHWVPLHIRCLFVRVYEYGGIHSGSAVCALFWFIAFTALLTNDYATGKITEPTVLTMNYLILLLLLAIVITAYPGLRFVHHNTFEHVHRFGGWLSLVFFWIELILYTKVSGNNLALDLIQQPSFWLLIAISFHIILPWLRLHKIECDPEKLSDHSIILHHNEKMPHYRSLVIAEHPLSEWHAFASTPNQEGTGGSLLVSHAGDWTRKTIDFPRKHYYVKGVPKTGVLALINMFRKVVIVTTGSGIGPVFSVAMFSPKTQVRLIWSARNPLKTFGERVMSSVMEVDSNAIVIDTAMKSDRPDLGSITRNLVRQMDAEAVFIISNRHVTLRLIDELRNAGIHAYGPNWDS